MLNKSKKQTVDMFEVKKKHSWRGNLIRFLEITLIIMVILGTSVWFLKGSNFSINKFIGDLNNKLSPKLEKKNNQVQKSSKESLKEIIEAEKVFEIESINEVQKGLEVKSKKSIIVIFSNEKDFLNQVRTLQTLLAKAKIDNKSVRRVDFRFEKLIVQY